MWTVLPSVMSFEKQNTYYKNNVLFSKGCLRWKHSPQLTVTKKISLKDKHNNIIGALEYKSSILMHFVTF